MGDERVLGRVLLYIMLGYAAVINFTLFISMLISLCLCIIVYFIIGMNDKDIVEKIMKQDLSDEIMRKYNEVFIMDSGMFVFLTIIIYNFLTKI